jgi:hypothetical protein
MDLQRSVHLHKCPSGEDIEEGSVVAAADLHFDDLVKSIGSAHPLRWNSLQQPSFYDHPSLRHDISRIVQLIQDVQISPGTVLDFWGLNVELLSTP